MNVVWQYSCGFVRRNRAGERQECDTSKAVVSERIQSLPVATGLVRDRPPTSNYAATPADPASEPINSYRPVATGRTWDACWIQTALLCFTLLRSPAHSAKQNRKEYATATFHVCLTFHVCFSPFLSVARRQTTWGCGARVKAGQLLPVRKRITCTAQVVGFLICIVVFCPAPRRVDVKESSKRALMDSARRAARASPIRIIAVRLHV